MCIRDRCSIKREKGDTIEEVKCNPWGDPTNPEPQKIYKGADIIYTCACCSRSVACRSLLVLRQSIFLFVNTFSTREFVFFGLLFRPEGAWSAHPRIDAPSVVLIFLHA